MELGRLTKTAESGKLSVVESIELEKEINLITSILNFNMDDVEKDIKYEELHSNLTNLPSNLKDRCPLVYSIVETLLLTKADHSVHGDRRTLSAMHALAILLSLRSQKIQNNFKLMFTSLCVSYAAVERFITVLNHLGLTFSWKNLVDYLDKQLQHKEEVLKSRFKELLPVIIMMDNINMYRGKRKHLRLLKYVGPKMWNFTGRGVFFPNLDCVRHLLSAKQKYLEPQKDVLLLEAAEIFLEGDPDKMKLWEKAKDKYLLGVLDNTLNTMPVLPRDQLLSKMSDKEICDWLKSSDFDKAA